MRNILVVKATGSANLLEGLETYSDRYKTSVEPFNETDLMRLIQIASDTSFQIKRSANPKLLLEMAMIKMIKMDRSVELKTLLSNLGGATVKQDVTASATVQGAASKPALAPAQTSPVAQSNHTQTIQTAQEPIAIKIAPVQETKETVVIKQLNNVIKEQSKEYETTQPNGNGDSDAIPESQQNSENTVVSFERIKEEWNDIVEEVKAKKIHLGSFLNEGFPTKLHDGILEISFGRDNGFHMRTVDANKIIVQKVIFEKTGFQVRLHCHKNESDEFHQMLTEWREGGSETAPQQPTNFSQRVETSEPAEEPEPSEEDSLQIPILKKVIEVFDGEIVNK